MYKLNITIENPMLGESTALRFQFDPATFDEKAWSAGFPTIRATVDDLIARSSAPGRPDLVPIDLASLSAANAA